MSEMLDDLVNLIKVEPIKENVFRGQSQDLGLRQLFGGQILGQALSAACQTVDSDRLVHSLHGYFLRRGDPMYPVSYYVDRVRDGGAFSARQVTVKQDGETIFICSASFQGHEHGFEHQLKMPDVPAPDDLKSERELIANYLDDLPPQIYKRLERGRSFEIRPITDFNLLIPETKPPFQQFWFRADGSVPDDDSLQRCLLLYMTDFNLLATSLLPHGKSVLDPYLQVASIDHSLWFHRQPDLNEWMLYSVDSPWAGNARGFSRASIFSQDGRLVASVCQEGLIRPIESRFMAIG